MKNIDINDDEIKDVIYYSDGQAITGLWHRLDIFTDFFERRDVFLWVLENLLREGRIKLQKNGIFLDSPIRDQIEAFRKIWPKTDKPYPNHPDADFYLWFFDPKCPAGIAWRKEDGNYEIAD